MNNVFERRGRRGLDLACLVVSVCKQGSGSVLSTLKPSAACAGARF